MHLDRFAFVFPRGAPPLSLFFFFNDTATTEIYTLSLHDALPILSTGFRFSIWLGASGTWARRTSCWRSEEHTSELQSHLNLVCRLLLEKKKPGESPRASLSPRSQRQTEPPGTRTFDLHIHITPHV